jgi:hypothetical protein
MGQNIRLAAVGIGLHRARALLEALVGVFDHHDGAVDQHAHGQDQAEHHDVGNRDAHDAQKR